MDVPAMSQCGACQWFIPRSTSESLAKWALFNGESQSLGQGRRGSATRSAEQPWSSTVEIRRAYRLGCIRERCVDQTGRLGLASGAPPGSRACAGN